MRRLTGEEGGHQGKGWKGILNNEPRESLEEMGNRLKGDLVVQKSGELMYVSFKERKSLPLRRGHLGGELGEGSLRGPRGSGLDKTLLGDLWQVPCRDFFNNESGTFSTRIHGAKRAYHKRGS